MSGTNKEEVIINSLEVGDTFSFAKRNNSEIYEVFCKTEKWIGLKAHAIIFWYEPKAPFPYHNLNKKVFKIIHS